MITGKDREKLASEVWRVLLGLPSNYEAVNAEWRAKVDPRDQHPELNLPNP
jgi:hypothetical protein